VEVIDLSDADAAFSVCSDCSDRGSDNESDHGDPDAPIAPFSNPPSGQRLLVHKYDSLDSLMLEYRQLNQKSSPASSLPEAHIVAVAAVPPYALPVGSQV
jgi:hypothetical protein